jgi:hypothetical protein
MAVAVQFTGNRFTCRLIKSGIDPCDISFTPDTRLWDVLNTSTRNWRTTMPFTMNAFNHIEWERQGLADFGDFADQIAEYTHRGEAANQERSDEWLS